MPRFNSHNARWRMAMNLMISVCGQLAGNSVLTYYQPAMFRVLGITSTDRRLLLTFANSIVSCFCAICGSATNDMIGRRTKLWVGSIVLSCLFACVTGFSSQFGVGMPVNLPVSNAGIASVSPFNPSGLADGCRSSSLAVPIPLFVSPLPITYRL
jgi:predicted MFS family arabinose efflux permease